MFFWFIDDKSFDYDNHYDDAGDDGDDDGGDDGGVYYDDKDDCGDHYYNSYCVPMIHWWWGLWLW